MNYSEQIFDLRRKRRGKAVIRLRIMLINGVVKLKGH